MVEQKTTGMMIYYYFVCKRKLWFFLNGISMESENENVQIGKALDEFTYSNERKHLSINGEINLDFVKKSGVIHEIKKSRKIEEASIWQVKYYLYYIKQKGVSGISAKIDYPLLRKTMDITLTSDDELKLKEVIADIKSIREKNQTEIKSKTIKCAKCAYYDLCFI